MKLPKKSLERKLFEDGYDQVVGVDEVGTACLAGPVYVCAVCFDKDFFSKKHKKLAYLRDSKMLLPHQREKFFNQLIKEKGIHFKIASSNVKVIDRINIYRAARLAMKKAIERLKLGKKPIVLLDGLGKIDGLSLVQKAIVKGDRKIFTIACASIIAKVTRDRVMAEYGHKYPGYGFEKHKGYPTKLHQSQLAALGPCEIHRKSFAPVAKLI